MGGYHGLGRPDQSESAMPLTFDRTRGHAFRTGTYLFDMRDGDKPVQCGVSDEAMDDAEPWLEVKAHERDAQFERLKDRILECAGRKYFAGELEEAQPQILIRTADLNR
jgi:hypothetical protein